MGSVLIGKFLFFIFAIPSIIRGEDGMEVLFERVSLLTEQSSDLVVLSPPNYHGVAPIFKEGHSPIATTLLTSSDVLLPMLKLWKSPLVVLVGKEVEDSKELFPTFSMSRCRGTRFALLSPSSPPHGTLMDNLGLDSEVYHIFKNGTDSIKVAKYSPRPDKVEVAYSSSARPYSNSLKRGRGVILMDIIGRKLKIRPSYKYPVTSANYAFAFVANQMKILSNFSQTADVVITEPAFSWRRHQKVDLSSPIMERGLRIQYRKPKEVSTFKTVVFPMDVYVWGMIAVVAVAMMATLFALSKTDKDTHKSRTFHVISLSTVTLLYIALPRKWCHISSKFPRAVKVIFFVWLPMGFMLTLAYKSNLLASLVRKEFEKPVDTFEDLLHRPIILAIPKGTSVPRLMKNSLRKVVRGVYAYNVVKLGGLYDTKTNWAQEKKRINKGLLAGTHANIVRDSNLEGTRDIFGVGSDALDVSYAGWLYRIGFPLQEQFNRILDKLQEAGIVRKVLEPILWDDALPERDRMRSGGSEDQHVTTIDLDHLLLLWVLLPCCLAASCMAYLWEWTRWRALSKAPPKQQRITV